jgi:hypothetical protein
MILVARSLSAQRTKFDSTFVWVVMEAGVEVPIASTLNTDLRYPTAPVRPDVRSRPVLTVGFMNPYRVDRAVGLTASVGGLREATFVRFEFRHRLEFNRWTAFHLSAGPEQMDFEVAGESGKRARGISAAAGFELPMIGVDVRLDLLRRGQRTVSGLMFGASVGTRPLRW